MSLDPVNLYDSHVLSSIGKKLYLKPEKADVYFLFEGSSERIPAHKFLLANGSDVFGAMFYGSLKEQGDITIANVSPDEFKEFLQFFYFNKVELSMENVTNVMHLGHKYDIKECFQACVNLMANNITAENVILVFGLAILYNESELRKPCESKIREQSKEVLQSTNFMECNRQMLNNILKIDSLSCELTDVFKACMSWVRAKSKQQKLTIEIVQHHLGESFRADLCTSFEYKKILEVISKQKTESEKLPSWDSSKVKVFDRYVWEVEDERRVKQHESTTFTSNAPFLLGYIRTSPLFSIGSSTRIVSMITTIDNGSSHVKIGSLYHELFSSLQITLKKPIYIKAGIKCTIRIETIETQWHPYVTRSKLAPLIITDGVSINFHDTIGLVKDLGVNLIE